tara:strand:- start:449 stop:1645 length:1197 start_codon:yes stop_codon:yes gene_type:complete
MIDNFIQDEYDVVVIGAGPAGSRTAWKCAENGLSVLLVEKRAEIGSPKRCAEGLSTSSAAELDLDIPDYCYSSTIDGALVYAPNGKRFEIKLPGKTDGLVLERKQFDKWLAQKASEAGAKVVSKTEFVDFVKDGDDIIGAILNMSGEEMQVRAKVFVAADGVESMVLRKAGMKSGKKLRYVDSGFQYEMSNIDIEDCNKIIIYFNQKIAPRGYVWVFPKGEHRANVGIGIAGDSDKTAKECLDEFIATRPELSKGSILEVNAGNIPVGDFMKDMVIGNVIGIGDSVNQVNPIHGGGIAESMKAALIADSIILDAIKKNDIGILKEYNKKWWKERGEKMKNVERVREIMEKLDDNNLNDLAESITGEDMMDFAQGNNVAKLAKVTAKFAVKTLKRKIGL